MEMDPGVSLLIKPEEEKTTLRESISIDKDEASSLTRQNFNLSRPLFPVIEYHDGHRFISLRRTRILNLQYVFKFF